MKNILRDHALRLALYLHTIGIESCVIGCSYREYVIHLTEQYCSVTRELRKKARWRGCRLVRETGGIELAASHLLPAPKPRPSLTGPWKRSYERHLKRIQNWPPETPPCLECRICAILPKRSWPNREAAEESRILQDDPGLIAYPCPYQPGYWHLGHRC